MPRPFTSPEPSSELPCLTGPQSAAVAKLAYATGRPDAITLLCGPAGVGKTTVLRAAASYGLPQPQSVRLVSWSDVRGDHDALPIPRAQAADEAVAPALDTLLVDDAHRASVSELAEAVDRWRHCHEGIAIVLAGEGRLLTLVAGDARLEQAVCLRATLPPFTLAETRRLLATTLPDADGADAGEVIRTIHEVSGGVPAVAMRLAEMTAMLVHATSGHRLVADDVETIHRRLCLGAA